ncbi:hypothetical protein B7P43_G08681 [Cryptotermes secundus]|uniref:B box-type domain-containing protein n=1 Tax=Cryptotermes secundus TaxID=105785 RepID=A0A2J7PCA6_9NEOP|nr:hypothetical protein B7P43_G08681 [Cryptotermes secundus]
MLMGIIQKPTLRSYFSTRRIMSTPGFRDIISRNRLELICKFLHFVDNETMSTHQGPQKLLKILPLISQLNKKFLELYLPSQNISVDESLTLWKGRLSFKQYLPLKASKFGIKTHELCDLKKGEIVAQHCGRGKKMNKWYMKLFRKLLNTSVLNALIYKSNTGKNIGQLSFKIELVEGLFVKYASAVEHKMPGRHASDNSVLRLTERHFISRISPRSTKARPQRRCVVCKKCGKKEMVYWCEACDVVLCIECFRDYHTKLNF